MEKPNDKKLILTDGDPRNSMLKRGPVLYKAKCHHGHETTYVEIDLKEYDERIDKLAKIIAKQPGVDLMATLKDALYDLPLDYLKNIETKINKELKKAEPEIETKAATSYRGTCVSLRVGRKNLVELRH